MLLIVKLRILAMMCSMIISLTIENIVFGDRKKDFDINQCFCDQKPTHCVTASITIMRV